MSVFYSYCYSCQSVNRVNAEKALAGQATCGKCSSPLDIHTCVTPVDDIGFQKLLDKCDQLLVVDFWASWCGPCRTYGPIFERVSKDFTGRATFIKVNTEQSPRIASQYDIRGIPATVFFKNGQVVAKQAGAINDQMLAAIVKENL